MKPYWSYGNRIKPNELTRGVDFMCGCIYGLVSTVSNGHPQSCTIANTILHRQGTRVSFFLSLKNHDTLEWPKCNSDKAKVGSVVCTVYTDGQPYKPCVLCETGFNCQVSNLA